MTLSVENVSKSYGHNIILEPLSWAADKGEILAVVGPSGSGKSTLLHLINLSTKPSSGAIWLDGEDLSALSRSRLRDARRKIGTAFQSAALFQRRTVNGNVSLPLEYLGVEKSELVEQTARLVERVGLTDRADYYPGQLSGGQKQRVGIARALVLNPRVLLADEITSGLDPTTTASILDLIRALRDELELTVVLVTHEMDVVRAVADKVLYLEGGKVVEYDTVAALLRNPHSRIGSQLLNWGQGADMFSTQQSTGLLDVLYVSERVPRNWVSQLTTRFETDVELIEVLVEHIGAEQFGRARIRVGNQLKVPDIKSFLASEGIAVVREGAA